MKSKKILSIALVAVLTIAILMMTISPVFALDPSEIKPVEPTGNGDTIVSKILGFVQWIGSALAVIMLVVIGIKYMVGSAEEKAEYKKTLVPYVVGAILIFAASNIAGWVYNAVRM